MKEKMKPFIAGAVLLLMLTSAVPAAQLLFDSDDILDISLEYNIKKLRKDKGKKRKYHPAILSHTDKQGKTVVMNVRIRTRGKLRRTLLNCIVPPFKMKFSKEHTKGTIFEGQKSLKLVTHCKNKPAEFESYYIQEYLVYRIFNILTPRSFRVRMANVTYIDSRTKEKQFTKSAFFIENYKHLAKRNNAKTTKVSSILLAQADIVTATLVGVFQYMIGNTDWSIRSGHNIRWIVAGEQKKYFPVPFDFDLCGIIDTSYARPDESFPIRSVRERLFRGHNKSLPIFNITFAIFRKHKEEILDLYRNFPLISEKLKESSLKYLEEFYDIIDKPKLVKRYFINNYRGRPRPKR